MRKKISLIFFVIMTFSNIHSQEKETLKNRKGNQLHNETSNVVKNPSVRKKENPLYEGYSNVNTNPLAGLKGNDNPLYTGSSGQGVNPLARLRENPIYIGAAAGITNPMSSYSDGAFAGNGNFIELTGAYYPLKQLGIGLSVGQLTNTVNENSLSTGNQFDYPVSTNSNGDWKTTYYGIGPNYRVNFGKFEALLSMRAGLMNVNPITLGGDFVSTNPDVPTTVPVYDFSMQESSQTGFYNGGIRFGYNISKKFNVFLNSNYMSAFSNSIAIEENTRQFSDINNDGTISEIDITRQGDIPAKYETISKKIKPQVVNYGIGFSYSFGLGKDRKKEQDAIKDEPLTSPTLTSVPTTIAITNPIKENKKREERKIILTSPENNSVFENSNELKSFSWKNVGKKIKRPNYVIEVVKLSGARQVKRSYVASTPKTTISANAVFKEAKLTNGQYRWKVTETSTGEVSNIRFFSFTNCEIDFSISNEEIDCIGYEQGNRKFKICFDATYSSPSGDLTYANPGSGLTVYDQAYNTLSPTLVSPNLTLVNQVGTSTSTVTYCFEVVVASSVTSIGVGLQGDDLDPSPILCQPGVSTMFDELPDCYCDECEEMELTFDDFNITQNGTNANQYNFNGNINVNVPIYGIEFQVQSYEYSASPSACSEGVSSLEESGVLLIPGTSINGSTSLQLTNETVSGSPSSNDNATKNIKYTSTSALTGAIPVNLTIGVPAPIPGLNTDCCTMEYTVCVKVKVFYDQDECKSCVFTHCFTFNNQ